MISSAGPMRTCIGCRRVKSVEFLTRYAYREPYVVEGPKLLGRGAWLCSYDPNCLDTALRRNAFQRALRRSLTANQLSGLTGMSN